MTSTKTSNLPPQTKTPTSDTLGARLPVVIDAGAFVTGFDGMPERLIITIDGPAGTGKSTVARALAHRLGLEFLDTGAMYRAAAAIAIDHGVDVEDHKKFVACVERHDLHFDFDSDPPTLMCSGESIMHRLRDADVTRAVSRVASVESLRQEMVKKQRQIGIAHPRLVTEGRDQGSVVFPDADLKFFMSASARVRAERRAGQMRAEGRTADVGQLEREISERDRSDSERTVGPLTCPADAERIDTSDMSFEQVVDALEAHVRRHLLARESRMARVRTHKAGPA